MSIQPRTRNLRVISECKDILKNSIEKLNDREINFLKDIFVQAHFTEYLTKNQEEKLIAIAAKTGNRITS